MSFIKVEREAASPHVVSLPASAQLSLPAFAAIPLDDDRVFLKGLRIEALIGVYDHERLAPQSLMVDLEIGLSHSHSCISDDLIDAVDYAAVAQTVQKLATENQTHLLEAFAHNIATAVLTNFDANWIRVDIIKPAILPNANAVGVSIKRAWNSSRYKLG